MADDVEETLAVARYNEYVRQAQVSFNQRLSQDKQWHVLRLYMGWVAGVMLPAIALFCVWAIVNSERFATTVVIFASVSLLADIVGLIVWIWKGVMPVNREPLRPVMEEPSYTDI